MSWADKVNNVLGACTSPGAFGESVIHSPQSGGDDQILKGIWSDTYLSVEPETGIQIMSSEPNIGFRARDFLTDPKKNDIITRKTIDYYVRSIEPDGQGGVTLILERIKQ